MNEVVIRISDNHGRDEKDISITDKISKIVLAKVVLNNSDFEKLFLKEKDTPAKLRILNDFKHRGKELWYKVIGTKFIKGKKKYITEKNWRKI